MDPYAMDIARRRQAERVERARKERLAVTVAVAAPGAWGRAALRLADLLVRTGESLRFRYRPEAASGGHRGWA
ncbi:MAG TPA: hypothetical protein VIA06_04740 [Candidatus Dormibacteraeota bacterium]|jgi:hypothetical protein|nr:hypothetical protein [Candidatus Dormibacteraeota bacterium]